MVTKTWMQNQLLLQHDTAIDNGIHELIVRFLEEEYCDKGKDELHYCISLLESLRKIDKCPN